MKRLWFLQKNRVDLSSISEVRSYITGWPRFLAHPVIWSFSVKRHPSLKLKCQFGFMYCSHSPVMSFLIRRSFGLQIWPLFFFIFTARCYAERGYAIMCDLSSVRPSVRPSVCLFVCLSVCLCVTFRYRDYIDMVRRMTVWISKTEMVRHFLRNLRPKTILLYNTQSLVDFSVVPKCVTLNDL